MVMITRNRRASALATLRQLVSLPERPPIVVVDNGSCDGTGDWVLREFPTVAVVVLDRNAGAAGRNIGVQRADTPFIAFVDDDSGWLPGSLRRARERLEAAPDVGLLTGRTVVGPQCVEDPINGQLAASPVLGFLACAAVVRRDAFLAVGGFHPRYGVGGEEHLLALDLRAAGWRLGYCPDVVARHNPSPRHTRTGRPVVQLRNELWTAWLRYPADMAAARTTAAVRHIGSNHDQRSALLHAAAGMWWVRRQRRVVPPDVAADLERLHARELT